MEPIAPGRFALQFTIGQSTHDKLCHAEALLSHAVPPGDVAQMFDRALDALICQLEKRKFAATDRPRRNQRRSTNRRYIPAEVKRAVRKRDGGQCTFVSEAGRRCTARAFPVFDHIDPVARGGRATVGQIRLRCRAHNQYEAERTFGAAFMEAKRQEARRAAAERRARTVEAETGAQSATAAELANEVIPWLRQLGFRAEEARRAAALCETMPHASLEERVRAALSSLAPPHRRAASDLGTAA